MTEHSEDVATEQSAIVEQQAAIADQLRAYAETANGHRMLLISQGWDESYATHFGAQVLSSLQQTFLEQLRLGTEAAGSAIRADAAQAPRQAQGLFGAWSADHG